MTAPRQAPAGRSLLGTLLCLLMASSLVGCALRTRLEARKIPQFGVVDPTQPHELNKVLLPRYVIEPPDELEIDVEPSSINLTNRLVTVQPDGVIDLGFIGDARVAGLTLEQAEQQVESLVRAALSDQEETPSDDLDVSVRLATPSRSKVYYVIGAVSNEGPVTYTGGETVLKGILTAGLRPNSLPEKAYLVRPQRSGLPDKILRIDWVAIKQRGDPTTNYQIFPGDRIVVPGTREPGLLGTLFGN